MEEKNQKENFIIYHNTYPMVEELNDEDFGNVMKSVYKYSMEGKLPEYERGSAKSLLFKNMKNTIDISNKKYMEKCEKNRENAQKRWERVRNRGFEESSYKDEEHEYY